MIKVLIVEDDPMVAEINKGYIESVSDYIVVGVCRDGLEAIKFLEKNAIALAVVDIYMPKLDGISLIKELRKLQIKTDIILVTASNDTEDISTALKYGAVDYLVKPFKYNRLVQTLENYKERYYTLINKQAVEQQEIDRIIKTIRTKNALPKGMQEKTLATILKLINNKYVKKGFGAEDLSEELGISSVTIRRYLEYLESISKIKSEIKYGSVGRPKFIYKVIKKS